MHLCSSVFFFFSLRNIFPAEFPEDALSHAVLGSSFHKLVSSYSFPRPAWPVHPRSRPPTLASAFSSSPPKTIIPSVVCLPYCGNMSRHPVLGMPFTFPITSLAPLPFTTFTILLLPSHLFSHHSLSSHSPPVFRKKCVVINWAHLQLCAFGARRRSEFASSISAPLSAEECRFETY